MTKDHKAFGVHPTIPFRLLSKQEVANLLGYTTRTVDRLVASRKIPFIRIPSATGPGTRIKFDSREIEKWILEHSHEVAPIDFKERIARIVRGD